MMTVVEVEGGVVDLPVVVTEKWRRRVRGRMRRSGREKSVLML
jgi:hypothetical protein